MLVGAIVGALLGLQHELRWYDPADPTIGFWESEGAGAILWGAVFGSVVSLASVFISNRLFGLRAWSDLRITNVGVLVAVTAIVVSAVGWDYIDGSEIRRETGRIAQFQKDFEE